MIGCAPIVDVDCVLNEPIHVATQGVLVRPLGMVLNGWIYRGVTITIPPALGVPSAVPPNNTGTSFGSPRREYFVREDKNDVLFGPLDFVQADRNARALSNDETKSGLAQVVILLGSRGGDPVKTPTELKVVFMYIRGRRTLGGRTAQFHSDRELPPSA